MYQYNGWEIKEMHGAFWYKNQNGRSLVGGLYVDKAIPVTGREGP
jgi:hypothetical protein